MTSATRRLQLKHLQTSSTSSTKFVVCLRFPELWRLEFMNGRFSYSRVFPDSKPETCLLKREAESWADRVAAPEPPRTPVYLRLRASWSAPVLGESDSLLYRRLQEGIRLQTRIISWRTHFQTAPRARRSDINCNDSVNHGARGLIKCLCLPSALVKHLPGAMLR